MINRGNFRSRIFKEEDAGKSFLNCLGEACGASGWVLHAWCLMDNHYHLVIETPAGNLVNGMRWLQSTFSNRFNRFRGEHGRVFEGRYKAIILDEDSLGAVCHYVHLNPVRAGLVSVENLEGYQWSSYRQLWRPQRRWDFQEFGVFLDAAGGLADKPAGRRSYRDYLAWLASEPGEQRKLGFERMTRGWAKGSAAFRKELLERLGNAESRALEGDVREVRESLWETTVQGGLRALRKDEGALQTEAKGAAWKVSLARLLREKHLAGNSWIAERLSMGRPGTVSQYVNRHKREGGDESSWRRLHNAKMPG